MRAMPVRMFWVLAFALVAGPLAAQTRSTPPPATALPVEMLGSWGRESIDCTEAESDGRLHVTQKALEFADSKLEISLVRQQTDGWWRVEGKGRETGQRRARRASMDLRLDANGGLLVRNGPEKPEDFVRCRPAQLQG